MRGWEEVELGDCIDFMNGNAFKSRDFSEDTSDIPLVKGENLSKGFIEWDKSKYWSRGDLKKFSRFILNEGDIVLAMDRPWVGGGIKYAMIKKNDPVSFLVQRVGRIKANSKAHQHFLKFIIASESFALYLKSIMGGVAVPHISPSQIKSYKFRLPPLTTQRRISSILSAYDDLIENNLKRIKLLEELAQRTYEEWFVKFTINGKKLEVNEETGLPEGWGRKKLGEVVKTSSGGTPSKKKEQEYYENGTVPWIRTGELKNFMLVSSELKITEFGLKNSSAKIFPPNTVLLAMYGNTIGETSFVSFEASTNQACCGFLVEEKWHLSYFLHQFLKNNKQLILSYRMGAAQENISQTIIQNIEIVIPMETILIDFGDSCKSFYNKIEKLLKQNRLLKESRDILLPRLMSGAISVEEAEEEMTMAAEPIVKYGKIK